jgi:hypothetical protein
MYTKEVKTTSLLPNTFENIRQKQYLTLKHELTIGDKLGEVECKLEPTKPPYNAISFMDSLLKQFLPREGNFRLWLNSTYETTDYVTVFKSPRGGFSAVRHPDDNIIRFKKKSSREPVHPQYPTISFRTEKTIDIAVRPNATLLNLAANLFDTPLSKIKEIGSYYRTKVRIHVISPKNRIYTINIDNVTDDDNHQLQQVEMKYKGTTVTTIQDQKQRKSEIINDIVNLYEMLIMRTPKDDFPLQPSYITKRDWLKTNHLTNTS